MPVEAVLLSYDVWQLACITLLILIYLLKGPVDVNKLHQECKRNRKRGHEMELNSTFFEPGQPLQLLEILVIGFRKLWRLSIL